jgi:ribosomal protein S18 acetylase RimI-like enzyme
LYDLQVIQRLGRETYQQHFGSLWTPAALARYLDQHFNKEILTQQLRDPLIQYYLPKYNGEPFGIVKVKFKSEQPAPPFDKGFELEKIYLLDQFVGKGFGKLLFSEIIAMAIQRKENFIWLDVLKSNQRARNLYEEQGFITVGEIGFSTDIKNIGMWVMRKEL